MKIKSSLIIGAMLIAAAAFGQEEYNKKLPTFEGKPAPKFKMTDINDKVWTNKSLRGKVVILDFWATWCGPCKSASPMMDKLYKKYRSKGLVVVGAETKETAGWSAKAYAKEHGYSYLFTTKNDSLSDAFGIDVIPAFAIIGKDGKVVKTQTGVQRDVKDLYTDFEAIVKPLLR